MKALLISFFTFCTLNVAAQSICDSIYVWHFDAVLPRHRDVAEQLTRHVVEILTNNNCLVLQIAEQAKLESHRLNNAGVANLSKLPQQVQDSLRRKNGQVLVWGNIDAKGSLYIEIVNLSKRNFTKDQILGVVNQHIGDTLSNSLKEEIARKINDRVDKFMEKNVLIGRLETIPGGRLYMPAKFTIDALPKDTFQVGPDGSFSVDLPKALRGEAIVVTFFDKEWRQVEKIPKVEKRNDLTVPYYKKIAVTLESRPLWMRKAAKRIEPDDTGMPRNAGTLEDFPFQQKQGVYRFIIKGPSFAQAEQWGLNVTLRHNEKDYVLHKHVNLSNADSVQVLKLSRSDMPYLFAVAAYYQPSVNVEMQDEVGNFNSQGFHQGAGLMITAPLKNLGILSSVGVGYTLPYILETTSYYETLADQTGTFKSKYQISSPRAFLRLSYPFTASKRFSAFTGGAWQYIVQKPPREGHQSQEVFVHPDDFPEHDSFEPAFFGGVSFTTGNFSVELEANYTKFWVYTENFTFTYFGNAEAYSEKYRYRVLNLNVRVVVDLFKVR